MAPKKISKNSNTTDSLDEPKKVTNVGCNLPATDGVVFIGGQPFGVNYKSLKPCAPNDERHPLVLDANADHFNGGAVKYSLDVEDPDTGITEVVTAEPSSDQLVRHSGYQLVMGTMAFEDVKLLLGLPPTPEELITAYPDPEKRAEAAGKYFLMLAAKISTTKVGKKEIDEDSIGKKMTQPCVLLNMNFSDKGRKKRVMDDSIVAIIKDTMVKKLQDYLQKAEVEGIDKFMSWAPNTNPGGKFSPEFCGVQRFAHPKPNRYGDVYPEGELFMVPAKGIIGEEKGALSSLNKLPGEPGTLVSYMKTDIEKLSGKKKYAALKREVEKLSSDLEDESAKRRKLSSELAEAHKTIEELKNSNKVTDGGCVLFDEVKGIEKTGSFAIQFPPYLEVSQTNGKNAFPLQPRFGKLENGNAVITLGFKEMCNEDEQTLEQGKIIDSNTNSLFLTHRSTAELID